VGRADYSSSKHSRNGAFLGFLVLAMVLDIDNGLSVLLESMETPKGFAIIFIFIGVSLQV